MTTYIKHRKFPSDTAIIMSATANEDIYKWLFNMNVEEYVCNTAKYMGRIEQYTNSSYSRYALTVGKDSEKLKEEIHTISDNNEIITFKCIEQEFNTEYHFGGIEGLNNRTITNTSVGYILQQRFIFIDKCYGDFSIM